MKRYIFAFVCVFAALLLLTSCKENYVDHPPENNFDPEYESKINFTVCDEYDEYEILGYFSITDADAVVDTVFLIDSINGIDLHTLYRREGHLHNQCNFENIKTDTVQSYLCFIDEETEISFFLTAKRENIPEDSQVHEINGYYFCVVDIRDTNTTYILSPDASKAIMGCGPTEFFDVYLPFYDNCSDLRKKASIDENGNLVLKMTEKDRLAFLSDVYCDIEEFEKIEGNSVSEDYSEIVICGTKKEISDVVWNHFPLYLPAYMLRLQFVAGNDPETLSVTVKVFDETSGELVYLAEWPKEEIKFEFVDGELVG